MRSLNFLYVLACLAMVSCGNSEKKLAIGLNEDTVPVKLLSLSQQSGGQEIKTSGTFTTNNETALSFKNGGIVNRVYVKEGDAIKAGQLLASLNPTEIDAQVQQAKFSVEKAERDFKRAQQLYTDSVATLEQLQNAETAFRVAKEQLRAANYNHNQTEIRATTAGFVLRKLVNDGQVVGPGSPIFQLNSTNGHDWQLKVGLSDKHWAAVNIGDEATVQTEISQEHIPAIVYSKSEGIDPSLGTFTVMLKLRSGNQALKIGAGMFAQALIKPKQDQKTWEIPFDAVLDGDAGSAFVFVSNDGKTAKKVGIGISSIQQQKVTVASGLEDAGSLIVSGSAYLVDGSPIRVIK